MELLLLSFWVITFAVIWAGDCKSKNKTNKESARR
jgi:hypothetical protein